MTALQQQIQAFKGMLPQLRSEHGPSWAVLADGELKGAFRDFGQATEFAVSRFSPDTFLIRHTDDVKETVPFVVVGER